MKFCRSCNNRLEGTTDRGQIEFICRECGISYSGEPADTLIAEGILEATENNLKYEDLLFNTTYDPAGHRVNIPCGSGSCKLNYMFLVRLGTSGTVLYKCKCGYIITHAQFEKNKISKSDQIIEK